MTIAGKTMDQPLRLFVLLFLFILVCVPAPARSMSPEEIADFSARLNLTPTQTTAVTPIMRQSMQARQATFKKYGVNLETGQKPGLFGLMGLGAEMNKISAWTRQRLSKILTPVQMQQYQQMVAEQEKKMKRILLR